jgi:hypothetical protein
MLVLFEAAETATPDRVKDILVNDRQIVKVEAVFNTIQVGGDSVPMPDGAIITLTDKTKLRVKETPRQVNAAIRAAGGR